MKSAKDESCHINQYDYYQVNADQFRPEDISPAVEHIYQPNFLRLHIEDHEADELRH